MASAFVKTAALKICCLFKYDLLALLGPIQTASSANSVCIASLSASEYTATVLIPNSRQARMILTAISPRFAINTFENICLYPIINVSSASATFLPSTRAIPLPKPAFALIFRISTSKIKVSPGVTFLRNFALSIPPK